MPRNGAGQFTPTAGIPVVSGTTISSTVFNNVIDDLGDEITASLPVNGVTPMTGVLRVTPGSVTNPGLAVVGDTNTGMYSPGADQISFATGGVEAFTIGSTQKVTGKAFDANAITDVASASTTDIGAAATSEIRITGTTTITSFGTATAGTRRRGRFEGALTLTHNGTSLILPGAVSITTAAGDAFDAVSLGSGNWMVTSYFRTAGPPASAAPFPISGTGVGQFVGINTTATSYSLPAGGTWEYFVLGNNSSGNVIASAGGIAAGGTSVISSGSIQDVRGWARRIS